jgi:hypothetical protein
MCSSVTVWQEELIVDRDTESFDSNWANRRDVVVQKESLCSEVEKYAGLKSLVENASDPALGELAEIMHKISDMIVEHPELRCQTPSERMQGILCVLQKL